MERVAKSTRWSAEEWALIERAAGSMAPTTWVREAALGVARRAFERVGPAAPEGRESPVAAAGSGGTPARASGSGPGVRSGTAAAASSRPAPGWAVAPREERAVAWGAAEEALRPVGSAGSGGPVPPAGVAASVVDPPPAADAPVSGVTLLEAATRSMLARGLASTAGQARALALRAIRSGHVEVFGEPCRDPERLVDPKDLAS